MSLCIPTRILIRDASPEELPPRMTRFWITLQQGGYFVLRSFQQMHGGEIIGTKIPSMRIVDLVEAMAPGMAMRTVGIRSGEKLHEVMCPEADSRLTYAFEDHFVIRPTINLVHDFDFGLNALGENGLPVESGFQHQSGPNPHFLTVAELRALNEICS